MKKKAKFSECRAYRYTLYRELSPLFPGKGTICFCMLNPSTADDQQDDPTVRRCQVFAGNWGYKGLIVLNIYALRSTDPKGLCEVKDPVGPENDQILSEISKEVGIVVCAWGANALIARSDKAVSIFKEAGARTYCLGTTLNGSPRHPLYVKGDQELIEWP